MWKHDALEWRNDLGVDAEQPAGVDSEEQRMQQGVGGVYVDLVAEHPMLHAPFELGVVGTTLAVDSTHTSGGKVTTATVIARFSGEASGANFYLTYSDWGLGRVVVSEIGHSVTFAVKPLPSYDIILPGVVEAKLFVNSLLWVAGG